MKILAVVIIAYTVGMLVIHLSSWKLLEKWQRSVGAWFSPGMVLRIEALYWLLVLASWPFWPSAGWKTLVVVFAAIHLGFWMAGELRAMRLGALTAPPAKVNRYIVAFDLVEAVALIAIGWFAAVRVV